MCHSRHRFHTRHAAARRPAPVEAPEPAPRDIVPEPLHLRASDRERDRVAELLRMHTAAGRLTPEELDERLDAALRSRTRSDLRPLLADLPPIAAAPVPAPGRALRPAVAPHAEWGVFLAVAVLLLGAWAIAGFGAFWPAWPIGFWALALLGKGGTRSRGGSAGRSGRPEPLADLAG